MEFQFRVKEVKYPIFIKADNYEAAQSQVELIGYTIVSEISIDSTPPSIEPTITKSTILPAKVRKVDSVNEVNPKEECDCCSNLQTKELEYFGRKLLVCDTCYARELPSTKKQLDTTYGNNLQDKIEKIVAKNVDVSENKWQELYNAERPAWIVSNFDSIEVMRDEMVKMLVEIENLIFAKKTKARVIYDSARELEAKLSREEREKLVFDPNFKVPENSQYKKPRQTKEEKAVAAVSGIGMDKEALAAFLKDFG